MNFAVTHPLYPVIHIDALLPRILGVYEQSSAAAATASVGGSMHHKNVEDSCSQIKFIKYFMPNKRGAQAVRAARGLV